MMRASSSVIVTFACLAFTACRPAPLSTAEFTAADEAAVKAVMDSALNDVKTANWMGWTSHFSDSAIMHQSNMKAVRGRPALLAFGQGFPPIEQFNAWDFRIRGAGNLAYVTSAIGIKIQGAPADTAKQLVVFQRSSTGRWEAVALSVNSDRPAVAMAPVAPGKN